MINYIFIFLAKILEVSLMTVRTVLITRGEKLYGSMIGFIEVSIWLYLIGKVLVGINEDPIRMVVYALGFACGNYIGSIIEERLALGLITINVIVSEKDGEKMADILRNEKVGVTVILGKGINEDKKILMLHVKRRRKNEILQIVQKSEIKAVVSVNDIKTVYGAYGIRK